MVTEHQRVSGIHSALKEDCSYTPNGTVPWLAQVAVVSDEGLEMQEIE